MGRQLTSWRTLQLSGPSAPPERIGPNAPSNRRRRCIALHGTDWGSLADLLEATTKRDDLRPLRTRVSLFGALAADF